MAHRRMLVYRRRDSLVVWPIDGIVMERMYWLK